MRCQVNKSLPNLRQIFDFLSGNKIFTEGKYFICYRFVQICESGVSAKASQHFLRSPRTNLRFVVSIKRSCQTFLFVILPDKPFAKNRCLPFSSNITNNILTFPKVYQKRSCANIFFENVSKALTFSSKMSKSD